MFAHKAPPVGDRATGPRPRSAAPRPQGGAGRHRRLPLRKQRLPSQPVPVRRPDRRPRLRPNRPGDYWKLFPRRPLLAHRRCEANLPSIRTVWRPVPRNAQRGRDHAASGRVGPTPKRLETSSETAIRGTQSLIIREFGLAGYANFVTITQGERAPFKRLTTAARHGFPPPVPVASFAVGRWRGGRFRRFDEGL